MIQVGKQCITRKGFTLVEALLVLALLAIVVAISMPLYQNLQVRTDLNNQANITAQTLRRAQALARAGN
ncbi:MAG TPA: prepilin-type N-terminal cleavage/methylation domain-containing protein, partial [bacterium]|nr:prepilin-type N-terminal cleavage/methylation domain-containing protein [bacterium]